jgi:hypothetical protein
VIGAATAVVLYLALSRCLRSPTLAASLTVVWYGLPYTPFFELNGLESGLSALALALFLWVASKEEPMGLSYRAGAAAALVFLARIDLVLLPAGLILASAVRARAVPWRPAVTCGAVVAVYLIVLRSMTGDWLPASGVAWPIVYHKLFALRSPGFIPFLIACGLHGLNSFFWFLHFSTVGLLVVVLAVWTSVARRVRELTSTPLAPWVGLGLAVFVYVLGHGAYRWFFRPYYTLPLTLAVLAIAGRLLLPAARSFPWPGRRALSAVLAVLGIMATFYQTGMYMEERFALFPGFDKAYLRYLEEKQTLDLPPGTILGGTDAGLRAFLFPEHRIVNLDGKVNSSVLPHIKAGTLAQYITENGITYVQGREWMLDPVFLGSSPKLEFEPYGQLLRVKQVGGR